MLVRYFDAKQKILVGALSRQEVEHRLSLPREDITQYLEREELLAVDTKFPAWQFDQEGPNGVVAGLAEVLQALEVPPLSQAQWLVRANPYLDGISPLDALKQGQKERVVSEARAVGAK